MTSVSSTSQKLMTLTCALGALGGAMLVLSYFFLTPGKYILLPFAIVVLGIIAAVRAEHVEPYWVRFAVCLGSFAVASLALYTSVALALRNDAITLVGHAARFAALLAMGALVSLAAARLSRSEAQLPTPSRG